MEKTEDRRLTTKEASEIINIHISQVQLLCRTGKIVCEKYGEGRHAIYYIRESVALAYKEAKSTKKIRPGWEKGRLRRTNKAKE